MFSEYPDVVSVKNLMKMLDIGQSSAYKLLQLKKINHIRMGSKYLIPKQSVVDFLKGVYYNVPVINDELDLVTKGD